MKPMIKLLVVAMVVSTMSCRSPAPIQEFDRSFRSIALVSPMDIVTTAEVYAETSGERTQEGLGKGLAAGGVGAAAVGALACGPFLYGLCVSGLMIGGMLAGGAAGALYGLSGFPKDDAGTLEKNVETLTTQHDFASDLIDEITRQVDPQMLVTPEAAEIQAVLYIENIEFRRDGDRVLLRTMVGASFESTESRRVPQYGFRSFEGRSGKYELEEWLDIDSGMLERAIHQSLKAASEEIAAVLNDRWQPVDERR